MRRVSAQGQVVEMTDRNGTVHGYSYDAVGRMTDYQQGTPGDAVTRTQSWDLNPLGNWSTVTTDGVDQIRTHNAQNEITGY